MKPCAASGAARRSRIRSMITSSGTSAPRSIYRLASRPRLVPAASASRRMSPVATCATPPACASSRPWVPFPAPGGPRKSASMLAARERPARARLGPLEEALVVAHQEVRLHLAHGVECHADDDQETRTAEVKGHVEPRSEEHTSELQSHSDLVCRLLLEKKKRNERSKTAARRRREA